MMLDLELTRRQFIVDTTVFSASLHEKPEELRKIGALGSGFNLHFFYKYGQETSIDFDQLVFIVNHGFDCVRIPIDYRFFVHSFQPLKLNTSNFLSLAMLIEKCHSMKLKTIVSLHRAPGYCVNLPKEPYYLWEDEVAKNDFSTFLQLITKLVFSFNRSLAAINPINEPDGNVSIQQYENIIKLSVDLIRSEYSSAQIIIDGLRWGNVQPPFSLDADSAWSSRGYSPMAFTHHQANWVNVGSGNEAPAWPFFKKSEKFDKSFLMNQFLTNWETSIKSKSPVIVGEWGVFNRTPHSATISYMRDSLSIWKQLNWRSLLWEFRGPFGIANSGRPDVNYERSGHFMIDTKMLRLLQDFL
jgi:endoglucanase